MTRSASNICAFESVGLVADMRQARRTKARAALIFKNFPVLCYFFAARRVGVPGLRKRRRDDTLKRGIINTKLRPHAWQCGRGVFVFQQIGRASCRERV